MGAADRQRPRHRAGDATEAFEDNEAPAAAIGIDGTELSLIVLVPNEDAVPERLPAATQAGNLTLRKLPKAERSALYLLLIAGHVLVTLREAFAVAPGVDAARVIAVRRSIPDIYGRPVPDCMVAGRWTRTAFNGVPWADADAGNILAGTATELVLNQKRGKILLVDPLERARDPRPPVHYGHHGPSYRD